MRADAGEHPALPEDFHRTVEAHVENRPAILAEATMWWANAFEGWKRPEALG